MSRGLKFSELSYQSQCFALDNLYDKGILSLGDYKKTGINNFKKACQDAGINIDIKKIDASVESLDGDDFIDVDFILEIKPVNISPVSPFMKSIIQPISTFMNNVIQEFGNTYTTISTSPDTHSEPYPNKIKDLIMSIENGLYLSIQDAGESLRDPEVIAETFDEQYPHISFEYGGDILMAYA